MLGNGGLSIIEVLNQVFVANLNHSTKELFTLFDMGRIGKQDAYLFSFFDAVTEYGQFAVSERAANATLFAVGVRGRRSEALKKFMASYFECHEFLAERKPPTLFATFSTLRK